MRLSAPDAASLPALVIGGPTASGKTALAVSVARTLGGAVVNGDAFQLYAGLPILTAQPSATQRAEVPHHLYGEISPGNSVDVASYERLARDRIRACWKAGCPPVLVGGSGLYLRAVLRGLADGLPPPDPQLRARLESRPLAELCTELASMDPASAQNVDQNNPRRVIRALEVCLLTGKPFSSFRSPPLEMAPAGIWLTLPRETLHARIAERASRLFEVGVGAEVRAILPLVGATARQVIGLQPVASALNGEMAEKDALLRITESTRQYARRQETWFRKESALLPTSPEKAVEVALQIAFGRIRSVAAQAADIG
jgi:tRNA dimethylallyltransferase